MTYGIQVREDTIKIKSMLPTIEIKVFTTIIGKTLRDQYKAKKFDVTANNQDEEDRNKCTNTNT